MNDRVRIAVGTALPIGTALSTLGVDVISPRIWTRMWLRLRTVGPAYLLLGGAMTRQERGRNKGGFEGWNPRAETLSGHVLTAHEPEPALLRRGVQVERDVP